MRLILENSPKEFIPLETEVEILQKYLETQKLRFGDRFEYNIDVSEDILTEHAVIPPMITQPFIENAIEHGQLHTIEDGHINIRFKRSGKLLEVTIEDNGIGRAGAEQNKKSKAHKSMAMEITRERIQNLNNKYGTEGYLDVQDLNTDRKTGTKVLISLPYKEDNLAPSTP
jgi:LytS/YehU family sensor histidine kinase